MPLFNRNTRNKRRKTKNLAAASPLGRPRAVSSLPTPVEGGRPSLAVLNQMRRHGLVAAALNVIKGPIISAQWSITADDPELAAELRSQLEPIWRRLMTQALTVLDYGHAAIEVVFDRRGERTVIAETRGLDPSRVEPLTDDSGRVQGVRWQGGQKAVELESPKYLWLTHGAEFGDPAGRSHLTPAWPFWRALTYAVLYGNRWLERHALPPAVVRYPAELTVDSAGNPAPANEARALSLAKRLNSEHPAIALPQPAEKDSPGWEIELLKNTADVGPLLDWVRYLSRMLLTSLFVPEKALYQDGAGSHALVAEQVNTFLLTLDGLARELAEQLSAGLLDPLSTLLGYPNARPRLVIATLASSRRKLYKELLVEMIRKGEVNLSAEKLAEELSVPLGE